MCRLFGFRSVIQSQMHRSLVQADNALCGLSEQHPDGWGVAYYVDGDVRLMKEPGAARDSACLDFIERHPIRSTLVLSHLRHATQGAVAVRNCQPFVRELGGAMHVFAHNGHLDREALARMAVPEGFRPVGETDSEIAFCVLLEQLRPLWRGAAGSPPLDQRHRVVAAFAQQLRTLGPANFLYADGDALFAHAHRRTQADGAIRPPGLHVLRRLCDGEHADFATRGLHIEPTHEGGAQTLIASVPLTADAAWRPLEEGELLVMRAGRA